jgi:hypothetical protein
MAWSGKIVWEDDIVARIGGLVGMFSVNRNSEACGRKHNGLAVVGSDGIPSVT